MFRIIINMSQTEFESRIEQSEARHKEFSEWWNEHREKVVCCNVGQFEYMVENRLWQQFMATGHLPATPD